MKGQEKEEEMVEAYFSTSNEARRTRKVAEAMEQTAPR